jgi:RNA polymerase sigma-70 factor (ECF subfamily)
MSAVPTAFSHRGLKIALKYRLPNAWEYACDICREAATIVTRRNKRLTDEVSEETQYNLLRSIDKYDSRKPFIPWVKAIARNCLIDKLRDQRRRKTVSLENESQEGRTYQSQVRDPNWENPLEILIGKEEDGMLRETVGHLPEKEREIIETIYFRENPFKAAESVTGAVSGTVKSRVNRALTNLRKEESLS